MFEWFLTKIRVENRIQIWSTHIFPNTFFAFCISHWPWCSCSADASHVSG